MSEEEKQAIEYIKGIRYGNEHIEKITVYNNDLKTLLNLIEKQQKEIENAKSKEEQRKNKIEEICCRAKKTGYSFIIGELEELL